MHFLGIDAGGSKTIMALSDENGHVIKSIRTSGISLSACGGEMGMLEAMKAGLDQLLTDNTRLDGVCVGAPCYGESVSGDAAIERVVKACFPNTPTDLCNDSRVAWAGSFALKPGVNIVTGTGSIGYGVDKHGTSARCGGWNWTYSDEGSGFWLGLNTLRLFTKQSDGRVPRGALYALVREKLNLANDLELDDVAEREYLPYRDKVAALQCVLLEAAKNGDRSAIALYSEAGREIALIVSTILTKLDFSDVADVSYSGGIFHVGALVMDSFKAALSDYHCNIITPKSPPWIGALMLALKTQNMVTPEALSTLIGQAHNEV